MKKKPKASILKLHNIPRDSKIFCEADDGSAYIIFKHLDGMYAYCETEKGNVGHLAGFQPLKEVGGGYVLAES